MNRNTAKISGGFTLIELLVVIAIIALLLAILGPSLGTATDRVEETICRSNLKQWAMVYALYANDNDDSFPQSIATTDVTTEDAYFLGALLPYYEDLNLRDCGSTKSLNRSPSANNMGGTFIEWGPFLESVEGRQWWDTYAEGSYGFNDWVADPPPTPDNKFWDLPSANAVRTAYEPGAYRIPMIFDSVWVDSAPRSTDASPSNDEHELDDYKATWFNNAMKFCCIDRHNGGINAAFVDMDARHVGIKELWLLKWHMNFPPSVPSNGWDTWTDKYKNYD